MTSGPPSAASFAQGEGRLVTRPTERERRFSSPALRVVSRKQPADDEGRDASRSQREHGPHLAARGHEHGPRDECQAEELKCSADEVESPTDPVGFVSRHVSQVPSMAP